MILREITPADLRPVAAFIKRRFGERGYPAVTTRAHLEAWIDAGQRVIALWDEGMLAAVLGAHLIETDQGRGSEIVLLLTDRDHPDRLKALDAICLYACNIGAADGRYFVTSRRDPNYAGRIYARDIDMVTDQRGLENIGDVRTIISAILRRRPQWRL